MMGSPVRQMLAGIAVLALSSCARSTQTTAPVAPPPQPAPQAPASAAPAAKVVQPPAAPPEVTPALIATGDSLFAARSCQRCHGAKGSGGRNGPDLTVGPWLHGGRDYSNLVRIVTNGVPRDSIKETTRPFPMNPRGGQPVLTDPEIKAISAYVWSISAGKK